MTGEAKATRGRGRPRIETPHPVDVHVGSRVRLRRNMLGMSQEKLGKAIGLTFQQVQKYERGANRIGSSRLFELSKVLSVPVSYFFEGMAKAGERAGAAMGMADSSQGEFESDPMTRRETIELVRAYYRISDPKVRRRIMDLAKSLADMNEGE